MELQDSKVNEPMFGERLTEKKNASLDTKKLIILIIALLVIIGIIILVLILIFSGDDEEDNFEPYNPIPEKEDLVFTEEEHRQLSRKFATEGMVLAKNTGLPIVSTDKVVLFGNGTNNTIYGGWGAAEVYERGTDFAITPVKVLEGMENKANEKKFIYEKNEKGYEIDQGLTEEDIAILSEKGEAERTVAVFTIPRRSGEFTDRHNTTEEDGTLLKESEIITYNLLLKYFDQVVVVFNVPGMMEFGDLMDNDKTSILISFLPGDEAGNAIADILVGDVNPSGHLTDTWAKTLDDYPTTSTFLEDIEYVKYKEGIFLGYRYFEDDEEKQSRIQFPFGLGLSYTNFSIESSCKFINEEFIISSKVKNIGTTKGKQVVQVYVKKPQNEKFIKAQRELVAFAKTKELEINEEQTLTMTIKLKDLSSYDDTGVTGNIGCYVLEEGEYKLYVGTNVAETRDEDSLIYTYIQGKLKVTEKLTSRLQPKDPDVMDANTKPKFDEFMYGTQEIDYSQLFRRLNIKEKYKEESSFKNNFNIKNKKLSKLPTSEINEINFKTVLEKKYKMEELIDSMTDEELAFLTFGHGAKVRHGAGTIGGLYNSNITGKYLIPSADTNDGPAGLRHTEVFLGSVAWPSGTLLASTFDIEILETIGKETGKEARKLGTTFWLAPGMNIHRNPLCGRNFEYFSEDPLIAGKMAAALSRGIQSLRVSITLKHFAFNDKENNRNGEESETGLASDSRMAERVAREIYLKGFEIAVKEGKPWAVMTSYNRINGMKTSESYDLLTGILRNEWGFDGLIMTDWSTNSKIERELVGGGNVKMPTNDDGVASIVNAVNEGIITKEHLKKTALYICNTLAKTAAIDKLFIKPSPIDISKSIRIKLYDNLYDKFPEISYEDCKDEDGGYNLINTEHNTWVSIYVKNNKAGYRNVRVRYTGNLPGFGVAFRKYEELLGQVTNLEATGGWQNWQTSPIFSVYLPEGTYELVLLFIGYDYVESDPYKGTINWFEIDE